MPASRAEISVAVSAPASTCWDAYVNPSDIVLWNAASDDWWTRSAEIDLRVGGHLCYRMEARDGSGGFDYRGRLTRIEPGTLLAYQLDDGRDVVVEFVPTRTGCNVLQSFDLDSSHPADFQRRGWGAILDRFARYVESKGAR